MPPAGGVTTMREALVPFVTSQSEEHIFFSISTARKTSQEWIFLIS